MKTNRQLTKLGFTSYTIRNLPIHLHKTMKSLAKQQGISMRAWMLGAFATASERQVKDRETEHDSW